MVNCKTYIPFLVTRVEFSHFVHSVGSNVVLKNSRENQSIIVISGAIIGGKDREHPPFLVSRLPLWYRTIFLFLEQIVRHHLRQTPLHDARIFADASRGKWGSKFPKPFMALPTTQRVFGILLKNFRCKLLQFEWSNTVSNLGMSRWV